MRNEFQLTPFQVEMEQTFGVIPADGDFLSHFVKQTGRDLCDVEREVRFVISHIYDFREPNLFEQLPKLKFAVASNHLSYMSDWIRTLPFSPRIDVYFTSGDRGLVKPSPAYFYALARALEEPPANILFIDDTAIHCEGAAAVGMKAVHFKPGMRLSEVVLKNL